MSDFETRWRIERQAHEQAERELRIAQERAYEAEQRAERAKCHCTYAQYCGPGCGGHTE